MNKQEVIDAINEEWKKKIDAIKYDIMINIKWHNAHGQKDKEQMLLDVLWTIDKHTS